MIDVPGDVTVTHRTGLTVINRLISRESLALTGGTLDVTTTLQVDGASRSRSGHRHHAPCHRAAGGRRPGMS